MNGILFIIITFFYCINVYMLEKRISKLENKLVKNNLCGPGSSNTLRLSQYWE